MALPREGVNPLRPYYIPPSIGDVPDQVASHGRAVASGPIRGNTVGIYTNKARDIFADIDYKEYITDPSPSVTESVRGFVDDLVWRYTSVLMAQPFEVARTLLQVRGHDAIPSPVTAVTAVSAASVVSSTEDLRQESIPLYESAMPNPFADDDSDPDESNYFAPNALTASTPGRSSRRQRPPAPLLPPPGPPLPSSTLCRLELQKSNSILEVISQLWQKEGAWGVWKGTNASFLYTVVQALLENWSRSLLCALFNVPDLGLKDDVDRLIDIASPYPWASLFVAAAAAVTTGLILSPLDLVRTRLICTPTTQSPRRALSLLRSLPSHACSSALVLPTILHSLIHPILTLSTPLVLRTQFAIDRLASPVTFSLAKFCASSFALFVKLPIETVLRRGQAALLSTPAYLQVLEPATESVSPGVAPAASTHMETIVPLGQYSGLFGTMYHIVSEEGHVPIQDPMARLRPHVKKSRTRIAQTVYRQGQGMEGLWRGWKVSWWGLVGLWAAATVGHGGDGEF